MDLGVCRQSHLVGHFSDAAQHFIRVVELEGQFLVAMRSQRVLKIRLHFQVHLIPQFKRTFAAMLVWLSFHAGLGLVKKLLYQFQHCSSFIDPLVKIR